MFEKDLLKNRTILITGGGTGLGRSMALRFADLGANLFLVGRREDPLRETAEALRAKGARAAYACADIRNFSAVEAALEAAEKYFDRPFGGRNRYSSQQRRGEFLRAYRETLAQCFQRRCRNRAAGHIPLHACAGAQVDRSEATRKYPEYRHDVRSRKLWLGLRCAVRLCEGRSTGDDALACR